MDAVCKTKSLSLQQRQLGSRLKRLSRSHSGGNRRSRDKLSRPQSRHNLVQ